MKALILLPVTLAVLGQADLGRLRLTQNGLDYAADVTKKVLENDAKIVGLKIPSFSKKKFTLKLKFNGGKITKFRWHTMSSDLV